MSSVKKDKRRSRRKSGSKFCKSRMRINDHEASQVDDEIVILAISLPELKTDTKRSYSLWMYCVVVKVIIILSLGIVLGVLVYMRSNASTNAAATISDIPTNIPTVDALSTSNPSDDLPYEKETMHKCLAIANGTNIELDENMRLHSFDIHMDVMFKFESNVPLLISELEQRIQQVLLPMISGCPIDRRRNVFEMDYVIESAIVVARVQENEACLPSADAPCYRTIATLDLQLKENAHTSTLVQDISEIFGRDPLVEKLGLVLPFKRIEIIEVATRSPSFSPQPSTTAPTQVVATYVPGKLNVYSNGLLLSEGLTSRVVARTGHPVVLTGSIADDVGGFSQSTDLFHDEPDGAAVFPWPETGGWVYVTNSEVKNVSNAGGVSALYFDRDGQVVDFQRLLTGTTGNCAGGKTPWGSWVTCEEIEGGRVYQVDPYGIRETEEMTMDTGFFESFAYDIRNTTHPRFFVTEDKDRGPLRRFSPSSVDWNDPWSMLHTNGTLEYLILEPYNSTNNLTGSFRWTTDKAQAKDNAQLYYRNTEGIDVYNNQLFVVSKTQKELFILDLDGTTYQAHSTLSGLFDGQPDQVKRLLHNGLLYFCEEGGRENGIHARDENGWFFTILESEELVDETTGLAFSPDATHMYVSYQHNGIIFDISREDGLPFHGKTLNVKYHELRADR